jgi:hypothetical protein
MNPIRRLRIALALAAAIVSAPPVLHAARPPSIPKGEYILVCGGPSLYKWERFKTPPHDHFWGNFIRTARIRIEEIRAQRGPDYPITLMVYRKAYVTRGHEDGRDLIALINSVRDAYRLNLIYFNSTPELVAYLNSGQPRDRIKIAGFEFFGHSNRACFMFDYSNEIDSASKVWLHETELKRIARGAFHSRAYVKSWGCHTGESMGRKWRVATGSAMWGAIGKTDYSTGTIPALSTPGGRWVR